MLVCCFGRDPKKVYKEDETREGAKDDGEKEEEKEVQSVEVTPLEETEKRPSRGSTSRKSGNRLSKIGKRSSALLRKVSIFGGEEPLVAPKELRTAVVGFEEKNLKHFFKHARLLSEDPLDAEEQANVLFTIRRQRLNDLLALSNNLKLSEHSEEKIRDIVEKLQRVAFELEAPLESKVESNRRILSERDDLMTLATYIAASTPFKYDSFEAVFEEDHQPSTSEILAATEDGLVSDWAPASVKLLELNFTFEDTLSCTKIDSDRSQDDLMVLILSSPNILKEDFQSYLNRYRMLMEPGLKPGGPTFVFLLTQVQDLKRRCKRKKLDHMKKLEEATKLIVEMWCDGIEEKDFPHLNIPLVTFVDLLDVVRFKMVMMDIARLFSSEKSGQGRRRSVFLTEKLFNK